MSRQKYFPVLKNVEADIADSYLVKSTINGYQPEIIFHFAAHSSPHMPPFFHLSYFDLSISNPTLQNGLHNEYDFLLIIVDLNFF